MQEQIKLIGVWGMKQIVQLIIKKLKVNIECKKVLKGNYEKQDELLKQFAELLAEQNKVLEKVKETNFKEAYSVEHELYKELEKENRKLRKELKGVEKNDKKH
jgi:hypothetical protein